MTEFGFIDYLAARFATLPANGFEGIGDDCAVLPLAGGEALLFTTDLLILYIANIAWVANSLLNVAGEKGGADDWFSVTATGYDMQDKVTGESEFFLFENGRIVKEWTKWDLTSLGKVAYIAFECKGSVENGYGMATPAYFAIDDVAVVKFGQGNK